MRHRGVLAWILAIACALAPVGGAEAGDDVATQARRHLDRGVELADAGDYDRAESELVRAYELRPSATVLWKLAQVYVALERPLAALEALEQYERDGAAQLDAAGRAALDDKLAAVRARVGRLAVVANPEGAEIFVDGELVGRAPLPSDLRVVAGEHRVAVRLDAHRQRTAKVTVPGAQRASIELRLEPDRPSVAGAGKLLIECPVPGVRVAVGGKPIGRTPFFGPLGVPRGDHDLSFSRPGYAMAPKKVAVSGADPVRVSCDARWQQPLAATQTGSVVLELSEPDAEVEVDGQAWPSDNRLPAGPHVLRVRKGGFKPVSIDFDLKAGEEKTLPIGLASMRGGDAVYSTETGPSSGRVLAWVSALAGLAAGGTALGLALWNDGRRDDWGSEQAALDEARSTGTPEADLVDRQRANDELSDDVGTIDTLSIGLAIGGGTLLVTGLVLFIATGSSDPPPSVLIVDPRPGGGLLGWATAF